jgi:clan AA aspartic protease
MIRGRVTSEGEPLVPITLHGRRSARIEAVLDTGFTGHISIARRHRSKMRLAKLGKIESELADGSRVVQAAYLGAVSFDGERKAVLVTISDAQDSLVGTALLRDKRVVIDFVSRRIVVTSPE